MTIQIQDRSVLRILDANFNRVAEGLRVVEEHQRFVVNDARMAGELKQIRHDLTSALSVIPHAERLRARDTEHDVGTQLTTHQEMERPHLGAIVSANFQRVFQSLRVIEEYAKTSWPGLSSEAERLRYRLYTLEKGLVGISAPGDPRLAVARLYVLIDGASSESEFGQRVESLVAAGVHVLQLRDKRLDDRTLLDRAYVLRRVTEGSRTLMIVNDRADLAYLAGADGVHIGQDEISPSEARRILGADCCLGISTHTPEQAAEGVRDGARYLGCGPTFPSGTKTFSGFAGLEFLRYVAMEVFLPAFAIGGISEQNLDQVLETGIRRIAVQQAVWGAADPAAAATRFLKRLPEIL